MGRAAVRATTFAMGGFGAGYLVMAVVSGRWQWWLVAAEASLLAVIGALQLHRNRVNLMALWLLAIAATAFSAHLLPEPHRTAVGVGVAASAAVGWALAPPDRRAALLGAATTVWALQAFFPVGRDALVLYQAGVFAALGAGLNNIGKAVRSGHDRYRGLFEMAPVALWEEDFSRAARWLAALRRRGVDDLAEYLSEHPEEVDRALGLVEVIAVNRAAAALIEADGATRMLGRIDPSTYTAETRPAFLDQLMTVWRQGSETATPLVGRTVNGRRIEGQLRWAAPLGRDGRPDYHRVVVSIEDVSELKGAQRDLAAINETLTAREHQLRSVVSGAPVILYAVDADGIFVVVEGSGLERVGATPADYLGASVFERYRDRPQELAEIRRALAGEEVDSLLHRAGLVWEVRRRPIRDEAGVISGVITVATDVTERHRAEQALEQVRHRHRMIIQNVSDLLFTIDGEGWIGFASPSAERILGYRAEEVEGMNWVSLLHPDDEPRVREMTGPIPPGGTSAAIEHRVRRSDGTWLHMESRATNLLDDPGFGVWVVAARDITDRLKSRVALESARDAAEAAARAKSELLANVSHEIRTPMNAILGMTDLALDTPLDSEQREYLSTVRSSAEALLTIIDDLLDIARFEAGRVNVQRVPFSVRATLDDVVRTMKVRADQKGLALIVEVHDQVPEWVSGDPGRLRQVVMNLVGNAVKFTDAGTVVVTARPDEGTLVRFEVADTGIGIAPEHLGTVFGAFEQADGGVNRRYGGAGLGLAISSKLVSVMGGSISAESRVGEGSVFTFTCDLPAAAAGEAPAGDAARTGPVVVVADPPVRSRMAAQLESAGHAVVGVATRAGALTTVAALRAEGGEVSAVVVDISEPEETVCRHLIGSGVLAGVPVIAVVSAGRRGDGILYREAGYRGYLARPLGDGDLVGAVRAVTTGIAGEEVLVTRHWLRERHRSLRVLVADDSPTNRAVASRVLEKRGHQVIQVADGESAVVAATRERFDVVIMDVQMPGVDGLEATRRIRATGGGSPGRRLPIVALTAHATEADRAACLEAGMDAYLSKPYRAEELLAVVASAGMRADPPTRVVPTGPTRRLPVAAHAGRPDSPPSAGPVPPPAGID